MADPVTHPNATVAANLQDAASGQPLKPYDIRNGNGLEGTQSGTTAEGGPEHVADPTALGLNSTGWVGIAALVVLAGMVVWRVPAAIARMLDSRIQAVRSQLDEAGRLRAEAEALKAEYEARARAATADAETMRAHAKQEANEIIAKAKADAENLMTRRAKIAEDRIAAAEHGAIAEVRERAAEAAARAAALIIAERHDAGADRMMVDRAIAGLGRPH
ncbi:F-type H+-transporting ATPase subunit b [Sphingomonas gellani]|uniref:ATP synthase subunit b n=1 Tax=Sphingomonas gellani TaxID=1166340 RepID=A0A1H7YR27_9SPHN|nr:hypothetical protein [Sphingomonas gellani]SEM48413.1 F-type H+-transporting ATPase subunit b [Sphingomonas gellani]